MRKGYNEFYHSFNLNFVVFKEDYVSVLGYEIYSHGENILKGVTRSTIKALMRKNLFRHGISGWRGDTDTEQSIGSDTMDEYNDCIEKADQIISGLFPKMLSKKNLIIPQNDNSTT